MNCMTQTFDEPSVLDINQLDEVGGGAFFVPFMIGLGKGFLAGSGAVGAGAAILDVMNIADLM